MKCFNCGDERDQDNIKITGYCSSCFDKFIDLFEAENRKPSWQTDAASAVLVGLVITILGLFIGSLL